MRAVFEGGFGTLPLYAHPVCASSILLILQEFASKLHQALYSLDPALSKLYEVDLSSGVTLDSDHPSSLELRSACCKMGLEGSELSQWAIGGAWAGGVRNGQISAPEMFRP